MANLIQVSIAATGQVASAEPRPTSTSRARPGWAASAYVGEGGTPYYALVTIDRLLPLALFTLAFVVVVIAVAGWKGVRAAWLAVLGLVTFWFNFVGVNLLTVGLHSYAGI